MRLDVECRQDVVFDTNVLSHAANPESDFQASALQIMEWMKDAECIWVLDDQGQSQPDPKTSVLYQEYLETLPPQSIGLVVFTACLNSERFCFVPRPNYEQRKLLEKLIPRNKKDRAVLGAAMNAIDKVLVSNDWSDFGSSVRRAARKQLQVSILDSDEAAAT